MKIRNRFSDKISRAIFFDPKEKRTKDSFKEECDINRIMDRYKRTGQLPQLVAKNPQYGDFSNVPQYQEALEIVARAEITFAALPASIRNECDNDPAVFLDRVQDPEWALKHKLALPASLTPPETATSSTGAPNPPEPAKTGSDNSGKSAG